MREREAYLEERLLTMFREADKRRHWYYRLNWWPLAGALLIIAPWIIFYGVALAIDKGF